MICWVPHEADRRIKLVQPRRHSATAGGSIPPVSSWCGRSWVRVHHDRGRNAGLPASSSGQNCLRETSRCAAALDAWRSRLDMRLVDLTRATPHQGQARHRRLSRPSCGRCLLRQYRSEDRLDFTVIGPAVNEVSRIASMCRSLQRKLLMSASFAAITPATQINSLHSIGSHILHGVSRAQELSALMPVL